MIVTQIYGGLGNQLFQFAFGKALAARLNTELRIDTRFFNKPRPHGLGLHHFSIDTPEVERKRLPAMRHDGLLPYLAAKIRGDDWTMFKEKSLAYDPAEKTLGDGTYLKGYWQTELYFKDHADLVRQHLQVITPPTDENRKVMEEQDSCYPVSLHVRRGDYVSNPKFNAVHGTCDLDYYRRAADLIVERIGREPVFFAFSDEPDWVRDNLKLPYPMRIVSHNGPEHNYEDIRLMYRCRHHIVANSSFSWWGAWLNPDPDKIVVAPKRWFADPAMQDHNLVPESWVQI